jgi:hypothetical protein
LTSLVLDFRRFRFEAAFSIGRDGLGGPSWRGLSITRRWLVAARQRLLRELPIDHAHRHAVRKDDFAGAALTLTLRRDGPRVIDVAAAMRWAVGHGIMAPLSAQAVPP